MAEGILEDDAPLMRDGDDATRLLAVAHLILEPARDVIERGLEPSIHDGDPFDGVPAPLL